MILGERGFRQPALPPAGGIPGKSLNVPPWNICGYAIVCTNVPRGTSVVAVLYVYKCTRVGCKSRQRSGLVRFGGLRLRGRQSRDYGGATADPLRSIRGRNAEWCAVVQCSVHIFLPEQPHRSDSGRRASVLGRVLWSHNLHLQKGRQLDQFRKPIWVV